MVKSVIKSLICALPFIVANLIASRMNAQTAKETNIVGEWQVADISVNAEAIPALEKIFAAPMVKNTLNANVASSHYNFTAGNKLISSSLLSTDTSRYQMKGDGVDIIVRNKKNIITTHHIKIVRLTADSLIYNREMKATDPALKDVFAAISVKPDPAKSITYTYVCYKLKEAKAPWVFKGSSLPKDKDAQALLSDGSTLYTLLSDGMMTNDTVFTSPDAGKTWQLSDKGLPVLVNDYFNPLSLAMINTKMFIASKTALYSSDNHGQSWRTVFDAMSKDSSARFLSVAATNKTLFMLRDTTLYYSEDAGANWKEKENMLNHDVIYNAQLHGNGNTLVIITKQANQTGVMMFSPDNGTTWTEIGQYLDNDNYPGIYPMRCFIANSIVFAVTQYGTFSFNDTNKAFHSPANALLSRSVCNSIVSSGVNLFQGGSKGVFASFNNGENWVEVNNKELREGVIALVVHEGALIAITSTQKVWSIPVDELIEYAGQ